MLNPSTVITNLTRQPSNLSSINNEQNSTLRLYIPEGAVYFFLCYFNYYVKFLSSISYTKPHYWKLDNSTLVSIISIYFIKIRQIITRAPWSIYKVAVRNTFL